MSSMRHRMAAPAHFSRQCTARAAPRSPPAWPAASQRSCVHAQQRRRAVAAADAATAAGAAAGLLQPLLAAAAPPALGSSQQLLRGGLELPPPALVLEVLGGCAGAAAAALAVAKLVLCDQLDIELHRCAACKQHQKQGAAACLRLEHCHARTHTPHARSTWHAHAQLLARRAHIATGAGCICSMALTAAGHRCRPARSSRARPARRAATARLRRRPSPAAAA